MTSFCRYYPNSLNKNYINGKDRHGNDKNACQIAITPDTKEYASLMGAVASSPSASAQPQSSSANLP